MNENDISPAHKSELPSQQMSSKEFQRTLYAWYEEKGLLGDLRSHLRVLMINKLKDSNVGKTSQKSNFSLSKQAFSLVIAEHLLRERCHYTLSIFSTEAPAVANQLPFSLFEAHSGNTSEWRFDEECVLNLLDLLGITKGSVDSLRINGLYTRNFGSLLTCLIVGKSDKSTLELIDNNDTLDQCLKKISSSFKIPQTVVTSIENKIEEHIRNVVERNKQQEEATFLSQISEKDKQIKQLLDEQVALKSYIKSLRSDLKKAKKQIDLVLQEGSLKSKEQDLEERLKQLQAKNESNVSTNVCTLKHCTEECQKNIESNVSLQQNIVKLEQENKNKLLENEKLHSKINLLVKDLQNNKIKIEFLSSCLTNISNSQQGIEETYPSSEETSENVTEEVLQQVRSKLRDLERESEELDTKFKRLMK